MMQICRKYRERVMEGIKKGKIDGADVSIPNLIDTIVLTMQKKGILELLGNSFKDKRENNKHIPFAIILILAITAKLKVKTSMTDIPYAINDGELLSELQYNAYEQERDLKEGLFSENVVRKLVAKYDGDEIINFYNEYVQEQVLPKLAINPHIHILDCTKVKVNIKNKNYENAEVVKIDGETIKGYKLGVLRGIMDDAGVIEELVMTSIKVHDFKQCSDMLKNTKCFKAGDILINDRGFLSRDMINFLKTKRKVDSYVPAKKNMAIYEEAVALAKHTNKWSKHPNKNRKTQEIQLITNLGSMWAGETDETDVSLNACVVHEKKDDSYYVFMTTDISKTGKQIINIYELRPEIEEDFRQIKDFWKLEDFKSTKYNCIVFHIITTLIGYLYFQLYKNMEEGKVFSGKSLPVVIKNYKEKKSKSIIIYSGQHFEVFPLVEFMQIYAQCSLEVRNCLDLFLQMA